ncbi:MAG: molybdenum cofactor guanylyltransferase [Chloroflexi bacterium]|nr:molybdenum cofactor guanylyltransferase [Chloroflexota bacterium]
MGTNKALLRFRSGETVIERIVARVSPLVSDLRVVTNTPDEYEFLRLPMHADLIPGASSLGGIFTGLTFAEHDPVLVLSCDLPLISAPLLARLLELSEGAELLMPYISGRQQPLHAVYTRACVPAMRAQLAAGDLKIVRLLDSVHGRVVTELDLDPEWLPSFRNMNTPEDWAALEDSER